MSARELLARLVRQARARPSLESALLAGGAWPYALYRGRWVLLRTLLRLLAMSLELSLLSALLPFELLPPFFFLRALSWLASGFHLGQLEPLRAEARAFEPREPNSGFRERLRLWRLRSLLLSLILSGLTAAWVSLDIDGVEGWSVYDAFACALALRFCLEGQLQVLQASLAAKRRLYRGPWRMLLPELTEPLVLVLSFGSLGLWSFGLASLVGTLVHLLANWGPLSERAQAWGLGRLTWLPRPTARARLTARAKLPFLKLLGDSLRNRSSWQLGFAQAAAAPELWWMFILLGAEHPSPLRGLYLLRPLFAVLLGLARNLGFDIAQTDGHVLPLFSNKLQRLAQGQAFAAGALAGLLATTHYLLTGRLSAVHLLGLVALLLGRSLFANSQSLDLIRRNPRRLLLRSCLAGTLGGVLLLCVHQLALTLTLLGALLALLSLGQTPAPEWRRGGALPAELWLKKALSLPLPVGLALTETSPEGPSRAQLVARLAEASPELLCCLRGRRTVWLAYGGASSPHNSHRTWVRATGGALKLVHTSSFVSHQEAASALRKLLPELQGRDPATQGEEARLRRELLAQGGLWLDLRQDLLPRETPLPVLRRLLRGETRLKDPSYRYVLWPEPECPRALLCYPRN